MANNNTNNNNNNNYENSNRAERKTKTVYSPTEKSGKINHSRAKCYYAANAAKIPPPRPSTPEGQKQVLQTDSQNDSKEVAQAAAQDLN